MRLTIGSAMLATALLATMPCDVQAALRLPRAASRCDCVTPPEPQVARAQASAVFIGTVERVEAGRLGSGSQAYEGRHVRFRVLAAWPGGARLVTGGKEQGAAGARGATRAPYAAALADSIVTVGTGAGGGDCGYAFETGETYLVYASGDVADLRTGICTRTRRVADAASDLSALGPPAVDRRP